MNKLVNKFIPLVIFAFVFGFFSIHSVLAASYNLSGKITNATGGNVSGATVDVLEVNTTNVVQTTTSNSSGDYSLTVDEGTYDIRVTPPGGQGLDSSITENYTISHNSTLDFTLVPPPVTVQGTITDYLGNPLQYSSVTYQYRPTGTYYGQQTDANGHYSLQVPTGSFNILIDGTTDNTPSENIPENWQVGTNSYEITGNTTVDYSVQVKKIDVHVEDPDHQGVENAKLKVDGMTANDRTLGGAPAFGSTSYQDGAETDSDGNATLLLYTTNANDGNYTIVVTPPTGSEFTTTIASGISLTDDRTLTVTLSLPVEITGTIRDYLENPLENIFVSFGGGILGTFSTQTNASGEYSIEIPKGNYRFAIDGSTDNTPSTVIPENWQIIVNNLAISEDREINYDLLTKKLEVHVTDADDQPIENVRIQVNDLTVNNLSVAGENAFGSTSYPDGILTDSDGIATLYLYATNSVDGNYRLVLTPPEGSSYTTTIVSNVELETDQVLPVELLLPVTLNGTITDYLGNPLENSTISLDNFSTGVSFHPTTDENGQYSVSIPPGNYRMLIDGNTTQTASNNIPEAWQVGAENISIPENKTINYSVNVKKVDLHVQNPSDTAIANALITVSGPTHNDLILDGQPAFGTTAYNNGILTNSSGNATLWLYQTNQTDGGYTITVNPPANSSYTQSVLENVEVPSNLSKVVILGIEGGSQPTTTTIFPVADNYIKQGSKNENEGASTLLRLQSSGKNRALVAFDESDIEDAVNNSQDYTATLQLTISDNGDNWGTSGRTIDLHKLTSPWSEGNGFIVGNSPTFRGTGSGATWNCAVDSNIANQNDDCAGSAAWEMTSTGSWPFVSAPTATTTITNNQNGVIEMDVTADIEDFLSNTSQNYGWLLKKTDEGANGRIEFGSRESATQPKLIITTN